MAQALWATFFFVLSLVACWTLAVDAADFYNAEDANVAERQRDDNFMRMIREMLGYPPSGKRADASTGDFPSVPGFLGARGRRMSGGPKRNDDVPQPPGFMGARGKRNYVDDYADNYMGAARG